MIHELSAETIQQIAAGEVIERPVSVVKELVENAVDAGAGEITVRIQDGGKTLISVSDDGAGIPKEEMEKAFLAHTTSKIQDFDDLFQLHTLGFRGEALASIVAVARVEARSKTAEAEMGQLLSYQDGLLRDRQMVAMSTGTRMDVHDLFSSVPVRRKFLKSDTTEANAIARLLTAMAIGHPEIAFRMLRDDHQVLQTSRNQTLADTLLLLFGKDYYNALVEVHGQNDTFHLHGYIGNNTYYRPHRRMQFLYVNGRNIDEDSVREAVEQVFRSIIPNGRFPAFQLFLETDPSQLDVNVHPNKRKIQFADKESLSELVSTAVREALFRKPQIPSESEEQKPSLFADLSTEESYRKLLARYAWPVKESPVTDAQPASSFPPSPALAGPSNAPKDAEKTEETAEQDEDDLSIEWFEGFSNPESATDDSAEMPQEEPEKAAPPDQMQFPSTSSETPEERLIPPLSELRLLGTLFHVYVLWEAPAEGAIYILDQHAAHERVNYERFLRQARTGKIISQQLLQPILLTLEDESLQRFRQREKLLQDAGFDVEGFGENQVILRAVPTLFKAKNDEMVFRDLLELPWNAWEEYDHLLEQVAMRACKASVKQGDALHTAELIQLYEDLSQTEYPLTCPHGRPTILRRTRQDFEKWFMRMK